MEPVQLRDNAKSLRLGSAWVVLLTRGNATVTAAGGGSGGSRAYRSPLLLLLPAGRSHLTEIRGETRGLEVSTDVWRSEAAALRESGVILPREPAAIDLDSDDLTYIDGVYRHLRNDASISDLHFELYAVTTLRSILLFSHRRIHSLPEDRTLWSISDAVSYIELHYAEHFTLEFFARKCAMNHSSFSRRFKDLTGYPLFEYINRVKIRQACTMLKREDRSVLDIATGLGYNNISFFNRYFRRVTGQSPSEFRKLR
jgi:AraC-like DNA-binding protein